MKTWNRVLLIDDEKDHRELYKFTLTRYGFEIETASNAQEGLTKLRSRSFGVAIVDDHMPNPNDGITLAQRVKLENIDTDLIILTGKASKDQSPELLHQSIIARWRDKSDVDAEDIIRDVKGLFAKRANRFIVYVEGKTDKMILETAWQKLYPNHEIMPYVIRVAHGATKITIQLKAQPTQNNHFSVGLFDNDNEGVSQYKKSLNTATQINNQEARLSLSNSSELLLPAAALTLPVPVGREQYAKLKTLCLEFYFLDEALTQTTAEGRGLTFDYYPEVTLINGIAIDKIESRRPEARTVKDDGGKTVFADQIVPSLPPEEFEAFRLLFKTLSDTFDYLQTHYKP